MCNVGKVFSSFLGNKPAQQQVVVADPVEVKSAPADQVTQAAAFAKLKPRSLLSAAAGGGGDTTAASLGSAAAKQTLGA